MNGPPFERTPRPDDTPQDRPSTVQRIPEPIYCSEPGCGAQGTLTRFYSTRQRKTIGYLIGGEGSEGWSMRYCPKHGNKGAR